MDDPLHPLLRASLVDFPWRPSGLAPMLRPFAGIKAVIFDFYDTLVLTEHRPPPMGLETSLVFGEDLCRDLRRAGGSVPTRATVLGQNWDALVASEHATRRSRDPSVRQPEVDAVDLFRQLMAAPGLPESLCLAALAKWEAWTTRTRRAPGARKCLEDLRQSGRVLGIGSNAQRVSESLFSLHFGAPPEALGLRLNLWSWRLGLAKPDPGFFAELTRRAATLHLAPDQILFVGNDPGRDIAPAARAGLATCLYAGDTRCLRPAAGPTPDAIITDFRQLPGLLPSAPHA